MDEKILKKEIVSETPKKTSRIMKEIRRPTSIFRGPTSVRRISPIGMRVVVKVLKGDDVSNGGLYLPDSAKQEADGSYLAEVIEVACAFDEDMDELANISGIPLGSTILIPQECGTRVPWDKDMRIIETADVLAVVAEIQLS